jgi:hypothetical protein
MNHLDDDAELYALGLTGSDRGAEIEAHLAACEECRARVAAAESVAASLAAALPPMPASAAVVPIASKRRWFAPLATAAALVFAATAAFEGSAAHAASGQLAMTNTALTAIAGSHFAHTTLTGAPGVIAKAIYARDGAWCYVVAENVPAGTHVVMHRGNVTRDLGALTGSAPATLFVNGAGRVDRIDIVAHEAVVARGVPVY